MKNFDSFYGTAPVQSPGGTHLEAATAQEHALNPPRHRNVNRVEGNYIERNKQCSMIQHCLIIKGKRLSLWRMVFAKQIESRICGVFRDIS
ncbi:hypothetical protein ILYODFUR_003704 [Ilyodon furcidens]|uniref:Uncharacterized protein n=1 Tax=Ilyodon furcidens TaxID=33524 RepID=A0ABV0T4Z5_9TELE